MHAPSMQVRTCVVLGGPIELFFLESSFLEALIPNSKTLPACPKPKIYDGWIRKSDIDSWHDHHLTITTQVISIEEYQPIPQTEQQWHLEKEIVESAEAKAAYLGMNRRTFLRSSCGMALAFAAMNTVFGPFF